MRRLSVAPVEDWREIRTGLQAVRAKTALVIATRYAEVTGGNPNEAFEQLFIKVKAPVTSRSRKKQE